MESELAQTYAAALRAIDRVAADPEIRKSLMNVFAKVAARFGLPAEGPFLPTALSAGLECQGTLLWAINKHFLDPRLRNHIADTIAAELRTIAPALTPPASAAASDFARDGIVAFPGIVSASEVTDILRYLEDGNIVPDGSVLNYDMGYVARAPHAFRIASDPRVLAVVHHHLGTPPTAVQMDAWWSLTGDGTPWGAQIFHRDRDDFRACKLFLYLTDVAANDGGHIFVRGSHQWNTVKAALEKHQLLSRIGHFFADDGRKVQDNIEPVFGPAVTEITGPAGTCFLENTFGFHRGKVPMGGRRCIFQVSYAAIPYPERVKKWRSAALSALPSDCANTAEARWAMRYALFSGDLDA